VTKKELSDRLNSLLSLNPSIDFTRLTKTDLERLLTVLEGKQRGSLKVSVEAPTILERIGQRRPLQRVLERVLER